MAIELVWSCWIILMPYESPLRCPRFGKRTFQPRLRAIVRRAHIPILGDDPLTAHSCDDVFIHSCSAGYSAVNTVQLFWTGLLQPPSVFALWCASVRVYSSMCKHSSDTNLENVEAKTPWVMSAIVGVGTLPKNNKKSFSGPHDFLTFWNPSLGFFL